MQISLKLFCFSKFIEYVKLRQFFKIWTQDVKRASVVTIMEYVRNFLTPNHSLRQRSVRRSISLTRMNWYQPRLGLTVLWPQVWRQFNLATCDTFYRQTLGIRRLVSGTKSHFAVDRLFKNALRTRNWNQFNRTSRMKFHAYLKANSSRRGRSRPRSVEDLISYKTGEDKHATGKEIYIFRDCTD